MFQAPDLMPLGIPLASHGLWRQRWLQVFFSEPLRMMLPGRQVSGVIGWGARASGLRTQRVAACGKLACLRLEDGFLRSMDLGKREPPLSIVVDDLGIYYDATGPSRLEALVAAGVDAAQQARALALREAWCAARVSKYNQAREFAGELPARYVLVVDQTFGDASITYGLASAESFGQMLTAALAENPDCTVLLKVHPDVLAGYKRGHFDLAALAGNPRVRVMAEDVHPVRLIERAEKLYVVTSQMGFEGLLWGKSVRCFGMPFYAGWGLTQDELPAPARRGGASLAALVHAALVGYPRYIDPVSRERCEVERVLGWLAQQRRWRTALPPQVYAHGFSLWKRRFVRAFLQGSAVRFVRRGEQVPPGATCLLWGRKVAPGLPADARIVRMEDGFVRSVGLGSDFIAPCSLVLDTQGIYFDPAQASDLEQILATTQFAVDELAQAARVREFIVRNRLTKYNLEPCEIADWASSGREVVLVVGQVEDDASIRFGCAGVNTNAGLLRAAREQHPAAFIVYKPHPDVMSGNRFGGFSLAEAGALADHVEMQLSVVSCIEACDVLHTLTSLAGFDALLRGKRVVVHGQPFYAGWGLTEDLALLPEVAARRSRRLTLDELVAGALLRYPRYRLPGEKHFAACGQVLQHLLAEREALQARDGLVRLKWGAAARVKRKLGLWLHASLFGWLNS